MDKETPASGSVARFASLERKAVSPWTAQAIAWTLLALIDALLVLLKLPVPTGGWRVRGLHLLFDVGQLLTCGLVGALVVAAWHRWGPSKRSWSVGAFALLASVVGAIALRDDLYLRAGKIATATGLPYPLALWGLILLVANVVTVGLVVGKLVSRGWMRGVVLATGALVAIANYFVLPSDYPGIHLVIGWTGATLIAASLSGTNTEPPVFSWRKYGAVAAMTLVAGLTWFVRPPLLALLDMYKLSGTFLPPFAAMLWPGNDALGSAGIGEWFQSREGLPPIPPTKPPLLRKPPIVILVVADAMRADVINSRRYDKHIPHLAKLRDTGTWFTNARSTAPATIQSITSVFSGKYFSQIYWTHKKEGDPAAVYPHKDPSVRFPQILAKHGVDTVTFAGLPGLMNSYGIASGWKEETFVPGPGFAGARRMTPPAIRRLKKQGNRPMFMYLHYNDTHAPYNRGGTKGTPFERYVLEAGVVDKAVGDILDAAKQAGLSDRLVFMFTGDHGEAFGEHGQKYHAVSLYDVLIHVPLLIHVPGRPARKVDTPVSLIDLGPTILDIMGQPTPAAFMGQSLVPLLEGREAKLTRPIVADSSRFQRAMVFADGMKIIEDRRKKTTEYYDTIHDPGELHNLIANNPKEALARLQTLHAFFSVHRLKRPGYKLPYAR